MLYSLKKGYETYGLDPETSDMYEIGIKKGNQTNYAEVSGYITKIQDTFTQDEAGGIKYYRNGGVSIHRGIELGVSSKLTSEVVAKGSYGYSQHYYENDATYHDNEMASAPNHMANGRLFYTPGALNGVVIMGEWQYIGSYWMDDAHVKKYGGYSIGNLKADYQCTKAFALFGKITNITDERYATSATYAYSKSKYTPGDPRQFFAGLEYTW
jgi:outer membrane receptor protein involved in Fe transport